MNQITARGARGAQHGWPRVALLIETSRAYGRGLLVGIAAYCKAHGPWAIEFQEGDIVDDVPNWMKGWKGEGIIARIKTRSVAEVISKKRVPTIDLYCGLPGLKAVFIRSDENQVGRLAAEHLSERGFNNFAFCGFNGTDWSDRRKVGFQKFSREGWPFLPCVRKSPSPTVYEQSRI